MSTVLVIAAVWASVALFGLIICRSAANADRDIERTRDR